jgi:hypothetical protein
MNTPIPARTFLDFTTKEILEGLKVDQTIQFEDGVIETMYYKDIVMSRYFWTFLEIFPALRFTSEYNISKYYTNGMYNSGTLNKMFAKFLKDIIQQLIMPTGRQDNLSVITESIFFITTKIYNEFVYSKIEYCSSTDILSLLDIQLDDEILDSIKRVDMEKTYGAINDAYAVLDRVLRTKEEYKDNSVRKAYVSGMTNPNQVKQVLSCRGYCTELNSKIFKIPISSSFTLGMKDMYEMMVESRSGAKALWLSNEGVKVSEWLARELQLNTMVVERVVIGDCGNRDYIQWLVGDKDLNKLLGSSYFDNDGNEITITEDMTHLIGQTIKLRNVIHCKLPNKHHICSSCFGELSWTNPSHYNIGNICSTTVTAKISQAILSTKHITSSAESTSLGLTDDMRKILVVKNNGDGYAFNVAEFKKLNSIKLIISQRQINGIKDLNPKKSLNTIDVDRVTHVREFVLELQYNDGRFLPITVTCARGNFQLNFLEFVLNKGYTVDNKDFVTIDLAGWKSIKSFIIIPKVEYNFLELNKEVKNLVKTMKVPNVRTITPELFVSKLFTLLNTKLDINIAVLGVIAYAFTVQSNNNIDVGRNSAQPQIANLKKILHGRSLSGGLAWGYASALLNSPDAFNKFNKPDHPLDVMFKPQEVMALYYKGQERIAKVDEILMNIEELYGINMQTERNTVEQIIELVKMDLSDLDFDTELAIIIDMLFESYGIEDEGGWDNIA